MRKRKVHIFDDMFGRGSRCAVKGSFIKLPMIDTMRRASVV